MYRLLKQCRLLASAALLFAVFILPVQAQQSSANLYDQAVEAMDAGNYRSAELLFRSIVQNNDEFSERASFQLAKSIHFQKRYLSAIFEFNRYLLVATNNETRSETRYWIAESYYQNGNKLQAIEEYKRYISQTITRNDLVVTSYRRIGFIYFSQRRFDESIIEWNRAISRAETESLKNSIRYDIAVAYFNSGQYRDAAKITNLIQKRSDEETIIAQCRILEGRILQNQGNHVRAVRSFETIGKKQYPVRPMYNALYYAAISYMKLGQEDKALQKLTLFIRHGRESRLLYDAQLELARIYRSRNEGDKSLVLCYDIIENAKRRLLITEAVNIAGDIYLKRENYRQARTVAENIRQYDITYDTRDSYILLVDVYIGLGLYTEAEELLQAMQEKLQFDPRIDGIQYKLSYVYLRQERYEEAITGFKKIDRLNPFSDYKKESFYFIAVAHHSAGEYNEALRYFRMYLSREKIKNRYNAYLLLLDTHVKRKDVRSANSIAGVIITRYRDKKQNADYIYACAQMNGQSEQRRREYIRYIRSSFPQSETALSIAYENGIAHIGNKRFAQAEKEFRIIIDAGMYNSYQNAYYNYALAQFRQREFEQCIQTVVSLPEDIAQEQKEAVRILGARSYIATSRYIHAERLYREIPEDYYQEVDHYNMILTAIENEAPLTFFTDMQSETLGPYFQDAVSAAVSYYIDNGQHDFAITLCTGLILAGNTQPVLYRERARVFLELGDHDRFFLDIQQADHNQPSVFTMMIRAYRENGQKKRLAKYAARRTAETTTRLPAAALRISADIAWEDRSENHFLTILSYYAENYPDDERFINSRFGRYYTMTGDYSRAYTYYFRAFQLDNGFAESIYFCGKYHRDVSGNRDRALDFFSFSVQADYDADGYTSRARIAYSLLIIQQKRMAEARKLLADVRDNAPNTIYSRQAEDLLAYYYGGNR